MSHVTPPLPESALDQLFRTARTHNELKGEVSDETLRELYDLAKWGPTSANMCAAECPCGAIDMVPETT